MDHKKMHTTIIVTADCGSVVKLTEFIEKMKLKFPAWNATLRNMELRIGSNSSSQTLMVGKSRRVMTSLLKSALNELLLGALALHTRPSSSARGERKRESERA